ncbi:type II toxin-antitoxin system Phd/YefM family antitoxin [Rhodococcus sp. NPDC054953]
MRGAPQRGAVQRRLESAGVAATTVKNARKRLGSLVREVNEGTVAVEIAGKRGDAVLISRDRYAALQEANFLLRSPELMDGLRREMARILAAAASAPTTGEAAAATAAKRTRGSRAQARKKRKRKK